MRDEMVRGADMVVAGLEEEIRHLKEQNDRLKSALMEIRHGTHDTWAETTARTALLESGVI